MEPLKEVSVYITGTTGEPIEVNVYGFVVETVPVYFDCDKPSDPIFFRREVRVNAGIRHEDCVFVEEIFMSRKPFTMKMLCGQYGTIDGLFHAAEWKHESNGITVEMFSIQTHWELPNPYGEN